jgi:hypothetical protein
MATKEIERNRKIIMASLVSHRSKAVHIQETKSSLACLVLTCNISQSDSLYRTTPCRRSHMAHHTVTHPIVEDDDIHQIKLGEREKMRLDLDLGGFIDIYSKP